MSSTLRIFPEVLQNGEWTFACKQSLRASVPYSDDEQPVYAPDGTCLVTNWADPEYYVHIPYDLWFYQGYGGRGYTNLMTPWGAEKSGSIYIGSVIREMPADLSPEVAYLLGQEADDGDILESGWFTVAEFLALPWDSPTRAAPLTVYTTPDQAKRFHDHGIKWETWRYSPMDDWTEPVPWTQTYREALGELYRTIVERVAHFGSPDQVRVVFRFHI